LKLSLSSLPWLNPSNQVLETSIFFPLNLSLLAIIKVDKLVEMGFSKEQVTAALSATGGDENAALEKLLGS
jgi:hypothetical protein